MTGISSNTKNRLYHVLKRCGPFDSNQDLAIIFIDDRIADWSDLVPTAINRERRIRALIAALCNQYTPEGENVLVLFLQVLLEQYPSANSCHNELFEVMKELAELFKNLPDSKKREVFPSEDSNGQGIEIQANEKVPIKDLKINQNTFNAPIIGDIHIGDSIKVINQWLWIFLIILFIVSILIVLYFTLRSQKPTKMAGDFRIAVANFVEIGQSRNPTIGEELANGVYLRLLENYDEIDLNFTVTIWGPDKVGVIRGKNSTERALNAEKVAQSIRADVIIYGIIENTEANLNVTPEFYVSVDNFYEAEEITGYHNIGTPLSFTNQNDIIYRIDISREFTSRAQALANITIGLAYYTSHDYKEAFVFFEKANEVKGWEDKEGKQILYLLMGNSMGRLMDMKAAEAYHKKALEIDPEYSRAYIGLASVYYIRSLDRFSETQDVNDIDTILLYKAINTYQQGLAVHTQPPLSDISTKASFGIGQCYTMLSLCGEIDFTDLAIIEFNAVIDEYDNGRNPRVRELAAESYARLGLIYLLSDQKEKSLEFYNLAAELLHDNPDRQSIYKKRIRAIGSSISE